VCNDGWNNAAASVVCRQLIGKVYSGIVRSFHNKIGATVLLNNISCAGQSNIFDCRHNGFGNHTCSQHAGVKCSGSHGECYCNSILVFLNNSLNIHRQHS